MFPARSLEVEVSNKLLVQCCVVLCVFVYMEGVNFNLFLFNLFKLRFVMCFSPSLFLWNLFKFITLTYRLITPNCNPYGALWCLALTLFPFTGIYASIHPRVWLVCGKGETRWFSSHLKESYLIPKWSLRIIRRRWKRKLMNSCFERERLIEMENWNH